MTTIAIVVYFVLAAVLSGVSMREYSHVTYIDEEGEEYTVESDPLGHGLRGVLWPAWLLIEFGYRVVSPSARAEGKQNKMLMLEYQADRELELERLQLQRAMMVEKLADEVIAVYDFENSEYITPIGEST